MEGSDEFLSGISSIPDMEVSKEDRVLSGLAVYLIALF